MAALGLAMLSGATDAGCAARGKETKVRIFEFVDAVLRLPRLDAETVAGLVKRPLTRADGNEYFETYRLDRVPIDGPVEATRVELRQPKPGSGATAGPLLNMRIAGPCVARRMVVDRYGDGLRLIQAPTGRSAQEEGVYEVRAGPRAVRFGFAAEDPDCLRGLSFEFAR